eukprot:jgi/Mesen1/4134/ME000218S03249
MSRTRYSPTTTVLLYFRKDIQLATGLVFDGNFSCTILMSPDAVGNTVWLPLDTMPVLTIKGANNILINNVDFNLGLTSEFPLLLLLLFLLLLLPPSRFCGAHCVSNDVHFSLGLTRVTACAPSSVL